MKLYRLILYISILIIGIAIVLPLITLREFNEYILVWRNFIVIILPAFILVFLLLLSTRVTRNIFILTSFLSFVFLTMLSLFQKTPFLFVFIFTFGFIPIYKVSQTPISKVTK